MDCRPNDFPTVTYKGLVRSPELTAFYTAVIAAEPSPHCPTSGTRTWRLWSSTKPSQPLLWPFLKAHVLLERDFYRDFLTQGQWLGDFVRSPIGGGKEEEQRKFAVLGQPGIGKSSFGLWLLAQQLQQGRTVVYTRNTARAGYDPTHLAHYVFHTGVAFKTDTAELGGAENILGHPDAIHICDSQAPRLVDNCHQVLITLPDPNVWLWYVEKERAKAVYFPLYSGEELEALRCAEYSSTMSAVTLVLRTLAWGCIPRAVFSNDQAQVLQNVESVMVGTSIETLRRAFKDVSSGNGAMASSAPHSLFVVDADRRTLKRGGIDFCSRAVASRLVRMLAKEDHSSLLATLQQLLSSSSTRVLAGLLFKAAAMDYLAKGGNFKVRPLLKQHQQQVESAKGGGEGASLPKVKARGKSKRPFAFTFAATKKEVENGRLLTVQIPEAKLTVRFGSLLDLVHALSDSSNVHHHLHRFLPASRTFAGIDSIEPGLRVMQYTVSPRHELKVTTGSGNEGLLPIARALLPRITPLRHPPYLEVFFVVPADSDAVLVKPQPLVWSCPSQGNVVEVVAPEGGGTHLGFQEAGAGEVIEVRQYVLELQPQDLCDRLASFRGDDLDDLDRAAGV